MNKILIVKHGAFGDVVRTSYFAKSIKEKYENSIIHWYTSSLSSEILAKNQYIDKLVTEINDIACEKYDIIYSLDDEIDIIKKITNLNKRRIVGAFLENNTISYTHDSSEWFDMGLLSKYGKDIADKLKKDNLKSHSDIFKKIFNVEKVEPYFPYKFNKLEDEYFQIGINPYAGGRWKSKELDSLELTTLVSNLSDFFNEKKIKYRIILLGAREDRLRNLLLFKESENLIIPNTDNSIIDLARVISGLNLLISSDSLAMHLAIAQGVDFIAFFTATSAAEIDTFSKGLKIASLSMDYCSYKKDADNSTITAKRIMENFLELFSKNVI